MRVRSLQSGQAEDMASQAGWLYADLFLALMVVFLATISFVPEIGQGLNTKGTTRVQSKIIKPRSNINFDRGLTLVLSNPNSVNLEGAIQNFLKSQKLPLDSQVVFMQIIGGFDSKNEVSSDGLSRAVDYAIKLRSQNPSLLANTAKSLDSSPDLAAGQAAVRLTFASSYFNGK